MGFTISDEVAPKKGGFTITDDPAPQQPEQPNQFTRFIGATMAPLETGLALGSAAFGGIVGSAAGLVRGVTGGKYGTPEGAQEAKERAADVAHTLTYQPRGAVTQEALGTLGKMFADSKLGGLGPSEAIVGSMLPVRQTVSAVTARPENMVRGGVNRVRDMLRTEEPQMVGVGAASTEDALRRRTLAADLPVPLNLTKGEASRDFNQLRFEKEAAKDAKTGEPLRANTQANNEAIIKNFEAWMDDTGAQAPSLRATGNAVDDALVRKANFAKGKYQDAYLRAEAAGELAQPVSTQPLALWIEENRSAAKLAPVISAVESELVRLGGATRNADGILFPGELSLNNAEKIRKLAVRLGKVDETNGHYSGLANGVIDQMTEGAGGKLYGEARQLFKDYAAEFKNTGAIKKLVSTKPGTTDRAVAFEDVFQHSVLKGSRDDTAAIIRSLEGAGPQGKQAIAELKGATMDYLKTKATENAGRDAAGNPIVSYAKLNAVVRDLERDGKLELLFGKAQAQKIRDLTELVADVHTAPPGVINTSTTTATLMEALTALATGKVPTATAKSVSAIKNMMGDRAKSAQVREALAQPDAPRVVPATKTTLH